MLQSASLVSDPRGDVQKHNIRISQSWGNSTQTLVAMHIDRVAVMCKCTIALLKETKIHNRGCQIQTMDGSTPETLTIARLDAAYTSVARGLMPAAAANFDEILAITGDHAQTSINK
jgi:hypothetical protein